MMTLMAINNIRIMNWPHGGIERGISIPSYKIVMSIHNCNVGVPTVSGKTKGL